MLVHEARARRRTLCGFSIVLALVFAGNAAANTSPGGWDRLGTGATPTTSALNGRVDVLFRAGPDALYAGGAFTSAGGDSTASHIARWDGKAWHSLGAPALNGDIRAIAYAGGKLYVGGEFTNAGGNAAADFVAAWDGASWQPFCNPITANVTSLQVVGSELYIGGSFADGAGLASADKLVGCDLNTGVPSSTVDTDGDINSGVNALTADSSGRLYAGGSFINMDQIAAADHVAMYDGAWHAMGSGSGAGGGAVDDIVRSLASDGTNVYVGTDSLDIGGVAAADHIGKWDGFFWSALGSNTAGVDGWFPLSAFINSIATDGPTVYVGGSFQNADGVATADMVASFDGAKWAPMGSDGAGNGPLGGPANAVAVFAGQAVAGGNFTTAGGDSQASYIARYPGVANLLPTAVAPLQNPGFTKYPVSTHWSSSDSDGSVVAYRWVWGDGTPDDTGNAASGYVEHLYASAGTYHPKLIVTDNDGGQGVLELQAVERTGPISAYTWTPLRPMVGETVSFHGAATDPDGTIIGYNWFLDPLPLGSAPGANLINAGPSPTHVFSKAGDFRVNMVSYECDPATCFGADADFQTLTVVPAVIPQVTSAAVANARFRVGTEPTPVIAKAVRGTSFKFTLKAPAKVTIAIRRKAPGVRRGKRCVAARGHAKPVKPCTRSIRAGTLVRNNLQPGPNTVPFSGRIGKRALKPGSYITTLTASNGTGKAPAVTVKFTIVK